MPVSQAGSPESKRYDMLLTLAIHIYPQPYLPPTDYNINN